MTTPDTPEPTCATCGTMPDDRVLYEDGRCTACRTKAGLVTGERWQLYRYLERPSYQVEREAVALGLVTHDDLRDAPMTRGNTSQRIAATTLIVTRAREQGKLSDIFTPLPAPPPTEAPAPAAPSLSDARVDVFDAAAAWSADRGTWDAFMATVEALETAAARAPREAEGGQSTRIIPARSDQPPPEAPAPAAPTAQQVVDSPEGQAAIARGRADFAAGRYEPLAPAAPSVEAARDTWGFEAGSDLEREWLDYSKGSAIRTDGDAMEHFASGWARAIVAAARVPGPVTPFVMPEMQDTITPEEERETKEYLDGAMGPVGGEA